MVARSTSKRPILRVVGLHPQGGKSTTDIEPDRNGRYHLPDWISVTITLIWNEDTNEHPETIS